MNISLTPELEKYIYEKLHGGFYSSVSEIIREALRTMLQRDSSYHARHQLNLAIEQGLDDLNKGNKISGEEMFKKFNKKIDAFESKE
ncbi:MAG: type II toxin-antitoxin system ParD family antitoxin [Gammaproteobacteria bacterium]|nr:type II toxin-antitoxin system ParD family antitoxin [Gammaproteobacteria bacterium]